MQSGMLRSFIAIELPSEVQASIGCSIADLQKTLPKPLVRWVAMENIHLTLKFLGDVSPANLEQLAKALRVEAGLQSGFEFSVGGIGAFPSSRRARLVWIGIEAPPALTTLQRAVENVAARMGYPPEERPFSPHLTVGRVRQTISTADVSSVRTALDATHVGIIGKVMVDAVHIFKSNLQPGGSVYTRLEILPFKQGQVRNESRGSF